MGIMAIKVSAELRQGQTLGFDVEGLGAFDWECGGCGFKYFALSDNKTTARCGSCGIVCARLRKTESDMSKVEWKL